MNRLGSGNTDHGGCGGEEGEAVGSHRGSWSTVGMLGTPEQALAEISAVGMLGSRATIMAQRGNERVVVSVEIACITHKGAGWVCPR